MTLDLRSLSVHSDDDDAFHRFGGTLAKFDGYLYKIVIKICIGRKVLFYGFIHHSLYPIYTGRFLTSVPEQRRKNFEY